MAYKRLRQAQEAKNYKYERPRHTEAHGWDNDVGNWKAQTTRAKTDRKRRKRGHKRNAASFKAEREKKLEDIFDRLHHKDDVKAQKKLERLKMLRVRKMKILISTAEIKLWLRKMQIIFVYEFLQH